MTAVALAHRRHLVLEESMRTTRIGSGAGFAGDRLRTGRDPGRQRGGWPIWCWNALPNARSRSAKQRKLADPDTGYDPRLLGAGCRRLLPLAAEQGVRVLSNMGAANPLAAGRATAVLAGRTRARPQGRGGDRRRRARAGSTPAHRRSKTACRWRTHGELVSANAYLGADAILPALGGGRRAHRPGRRPVAVPRRRSRTGSAGSWPTGRHWRPRAR